MLCWNAPISRSSKPTHEAILAFLVWNNFSDCTIWVEACPPIPCPHKSEPLSPLGRANPAKWVFNGSVSPYQSVSYLHTKARISYCVCQGKEAQDWGGWGRSPTHCWISWTGGCGLVLRLRGVLGESFAYTVTKSTVHHWKCLGCNNHISTHFPLWIYLLTVSYPHFCIRLEAFFVLSWMQIHYSAEAVPEAVHHMIRSTHLAGG